MADIDVQGVKKSFGKVEALRGVSFSVKSGEFAVLLGPSGSGKTTLLRCIAGLEKPDAGEVLLGGNPMTGVEPRERDVAMVFQSYALFPHMTVRRNIAFPLKVRGRPEKEIDTRVKEVAKKLDIEGSLDKFPRQLSGGEQQRVAIGRAIVHPTAALLMDEPLSSLDAPLRAQLRTELKGLQRELGITVVYVTHDQVEAMALGNKVGVMDGGTLIQYGTPQDLYARPNSPFVAKFVGTPGANLVVVTVVAGAQGGVLKGDGFELTVPPSMSGRLAKAEGGSLTLAVRPEQITLDVKEKPGFLEVPVELVEPLGANTILDVKLGRVSMKALVPREFSVQAGDKVYWKVELERYSVFATATGAPL